MNCPKCGMTGIVVKCDACGDVRCNSSSSNPTKKLAGCGNSKGPFGRAEAGVRNQKCKACKKGTYKAV